MKHSRSVIGRSRRRSRSRSHCWYRLPARIISLGAFRTFLIIATTITTSIIKTTATSSTMAHIECGVYLAPSSIPGAGLGMYVGNRTIQEGTAVTDEDILIPIIERTWHNEKHLTEKNFLWDEYIWNSNIFPFTEPEIGLDLLDDMQMVSPGVGSAANCYLTMVNVVDNDIKVSREGLLNDSPGQGAFSIYHGRSFRATNEMEPGQEIFVNYGEEYFGHREHIYGILPMQDDFDAADEILKIAQSLTIYNDGIVATAEDEDATDEDDETVREEVWDDLHSVIKDISNNPYTKPSRMLNAIPSDPSIAKEVLEDGGGGTAWQDHKRSIRALEWLEEHGQCADNIGVGKSTIPDAGRGAFATRFVPSGGLVSPAPLVHVGDLDTMAMFTEHVYNKKDKLVPNRSGAYTWQLMLNYCFAHEQSTLLLCPYGLLSSLINHSSGENANTRIQWSEKDRMRHPEWLENPIEAWAAEYHTGLQFDFVAKRDIEKGEELLIDYGPLWQDAWDTHVRAFRFDEYRFEQYLPSYELDELLLKEDNDLSFRLRTEDDRDYRLDGVQLYCRGWYLAKYGIEMQHWTRETPMCSIVRKLGKDSYLVRIIEWIDNSKDRRSDYYAYHQKSPIIRGLPRDAFFFEDLPYARDIHQEWAFRHPMMIPDDMFPKIWKNADNEPNGRTFLEFVKRALDDEEKDDEDEGEDDDDDDDEDEGEDDDDDDDENEEEEDNEDYQNDEEEDDDDDDDQSDDEEGDIEDNDYNYDGEEDEEYGDENDVVEENDNYYDEEK
mmetsp:Transcript_2891/g.6202  ORF Transcript_2891/g.6202 Transcript_2891/m.6202 type:complete len:776 (+) Transcript_2891:233-2560(+)